MTFLFVMALLQAITTILQAKYLAETITNLFNGEQLSKQLLPISLFLIFYLGKQLIALIREKRMTSFSAGVGSTIRQRFTHKLFKLGLNITATNVQAILVTMHLKVFLR